MDNWLDDILYWDDSFPKDKYDLESAKVKYKSRKHWAEDTIRFSLAVLDGGGHLDADQTQDFCDAIAYKELH